MYLDKIQSMIKKTKFDKNFNATLCTINALVTSGIVINSLVNSSKPDGVWLGVSIPLTAYYALNWYFKQRQLKRLTKVKEEIESVDTAMFNVNRELLFAFTIGSDNIVDDSRDFKDVIELSEDQYTMEPLDKGSSFHL